MYVCMNVCMYVCMHVWLYVCRLAFETFRRGLTEKEFQQMFKLNSSRFDAVVRTLRENEDRVGAPAQFKGYLGATITLDAQLAITLRWLAGGSYLDIRHFFGVGQTTFFEIVHRTIDSINALHCFTNWDMENFPEYDLQQLELGFAGILKFTCLL